MTFQELRYLITTYISPLLKEGRFQLLIWKCTFKTLVPKCINIFAKHVYVFWLLFRPQLYAAESQDVATCFKSEAASRDLKPLTSHS